MSSQNSRYAGQQVVNSFNIFIDTEKASLVGDRQSKGDNTKIHFEGNAISANDGELIRLSLTNFTMLNNIYMIDVNNSGFNIQLSNSGYTDGVKTISTKLTHQNYQTVKDIATNMILKTKNALLTEATALGANTGVWTLIGTASPSASTMSETSNRLLQFTLESQTLAGAATAHNITACKFQCIDDNYIILGGNRIDNNENLSSLKIEISGSNRIIVSGYYPMTRMSDPYVYIRCGLAQNSLEMSVLSNDRGSFSQDVLNSDILGKVIRDVEFISYDSATGNEFFINLQQKKLSQLNLFLTDSKGRMLGRVSNHRNLQTSAGLETSNGVFEGVSQSTQGNLFFTAVMKVDIIKVSQPQLLESKPLGILSNPSKTQNGILTWQDYGNPKY